MERPLAVEDGALDTPPGKANADYNTSKFNKL
jgi:hypothetical protein